MYSLLLDETTKAKKDRITEIDCYNAMKRCVRFERCNAPLCPLDPDVQKRTYIKGEAVCRLDPRELMIVLNRRFEKQYREFRKVCQRKGAKLRSLKVARDGNKKYPEYQQLEIKAFLEQD